MAGRTARLWPPPLLVVALASLLVSAQDENLTVLTTATQDVPDWAEPNALHLNTSSQPGNDYTVIPLTPSIGLNGTGTVRGSVHIMGTLKAANSTSYSSLRGNDTIAFLSCDRSSSDGFITPDKMLARLMKASPLLSAIILYSTEKNICLITDDGPLPYTSILTMADAGDAGGVLAHLNGSQTRNPVHALIYGTTGKKTTDTGSNNSGGKNSTVAMSILYSITGVITLLFLIIIATGAVRAHRYPERYGPRGVYGGRPRQSRAKGLARAVLDTIPIVKFGNPQVAKPDPDMELDAGNTDGQDAPTVRDASDVSSGNEPIEATTAVGAAKAIMATPCNNDQKKALARDSSAEEDMDSTADAMVDDEAHPGCSICTEDFKVGEDVRVLPCTHRFHPHCVDPWLVNVSGTCPLCRLDLRLGRPSPPAELSGPPESLAPPLGLEGDEMDQTHTPHDHRLTRLFDLNQLRQASVEERIEVLRQIRSQMRHQEMGYSDTTPTGRPQAARLTDKLKDKFKILTRAQAAR